MTFARSVSNTQGAWDSFPGLFAFTARSLPGAAKGRWMVVVAGDLDGDGAPDLAVGGAYPEMAVPPPGGRQLASPPGLLLLHNRRSKVETGR